MMLAFIVDTPPYPVGGVAAIYQFAMSMAARGHDAHLFHVGGYEPLTKDLAVDVPWFSFPEGVSHHFAPGSPDDFDAFGRADFVFGYSAEGSMPHHVGLPAVFVQGYRMLDQGQELAGYQAPCPKICIAGWLVEVGRSLGVPDAQLVHIPYGLDHDQFRVTRPIEPRSPRLSFCYNPHPQKGGALALAVLEAVKAKVPHLEATVFGSKPPTEPLPGWISFRTDPPRRELVDEVYNSSSVFLCPSVVEGFGLPCIEAMACGAALVTTDNGGSRDYAIHDHTALVSPPEDAEAMTANVLRLLRDDGERIALAAAGRRYVERFQWAETASQLEQFLGRYQADPAAFGRPATAV